jgi:hypothetical protein
VYGKISRRILAMADISRLTITKLVKNSSILHSTNANVVLYKKAVDILATHISADPSQAPTAQLPTKEVDLGARFSKEYNHILESGTEPKRS